MARALKVLRARHRRGNYGLPRGFPGRAFQQWLTLSYESRPLIPRGLSQGGMQGTVEAWFVSNGVMIHEPFYTSIILLITPSR
jgi:hypothetical protein